jgi:WD40 repeat protein
MRVVTGSKDGTTRLWDVENVREILRLQQDEPIENASPSADAKRLVTAGTDSLARV